MKSISWLDHIVNLLVVILGISIAFYLEGYKETSNNKRQEEKYIESLIEDLQTDIRSIDTLLVANERILNSLIKLSNASVGMQTLTDSLLVNCMFAIQYNPPFSPQRTTYESLKSSGDMDLIGDLRLRNEVVALYEQVYRGADQYDLVLAEHIRDFVKPYYMENVEFKAAYAIKDDFLVDKKFRNIVFAYRYLFLAKNEYYKQMKDKTSEAVTSLKAHLGEHS